MNREYEIEQTVTCSCEATNNKRIYDSDCWSCNVLISKIFIDKSDVAFLIRGNFL